MTFPLLEGVKVIELGQNISAPYCTKLMTALGAEVIKVERPGEGDPTRRLGPFLQGRADTEKSGLYLYLNTGKKSVTLDIKTAMGQKIIKELAASSDLLVENLGLAVLSETGLTYEALSRQNPTLVMCSISTFGHMGPYRNFKGDELSAQAISSAMYIQGDPERSPVKWAEYPFSYVAGLYAFTGSVAALYGARIDGNGQHVDISTAEAGATTLGTALVKYQYAGILERRGKSAMGMFTPCSDGFVILSLAGDMWYRLVKLMGDDIKNDPRFKTETDRLANFGDIEALVSAWTLQFTRQEAVETGQKIGLAIDYVYDIADVVNSPQYQARGFFSEIDHPCAGQLRYPGLPFTIEDSRCQETRAPLLGEHNQEVYTERLGYHADDLAKLFATGII